VTYRINRQHPLVEAIERLLPEHDTPFFDQLLQVLEGTFPFDALYADMAAERRPDVAATAQEDEQQLLDLAQRIINAMGDDTNAVARFIAEIPSTEPYAQLPNVTARITQKLAP
jgi:hypothetical protein